MNQTVIVLGAGYAGILACNRLAKLNRKLNITLINDGDYFVERIRNHEIASGKKLNEYPIRNLLRNHVQFLNARALHLDPVLRKVQVSTLSEPLAYDYLIYALGSTWIQSKGSFQNVITKAHSKQLHSHFQTNPSGMAWIVGAGLTGIELVMELSETYPHWKFGIVTKGSFASSFSKKGTHYLRKVFMKNNIQIAENTEITKHTNGEIYLANGSKFKCDLQIHTQGFLSSQLAKDSGLKTNERNQVYINPYLQVPSFPEIYVAGDASCLEGSDLRMGCVTAMPMGVYAAECIQRSILHQKLKPFEFKFTGRCVSLGRKHGLIQLTNAKDHPTERIITGRMGAFIKELVCKYTLVSLKLEKRLPFRAYFWPKEKLTSLTIP
jgi:NADH dehydrogenase FAD-containing subunit